MTGVGFDHVESKRPVLRRFEDRDLVPLPAYRNDPEVARYQGWESVTPRLKTYTAHTLAAHDGERMSGFVVLDGDCLSYPCVGPEYYGCGTGRPARLGLGRIGPGAFTLALAGNARALALYRGEGFAVARTFESENAGYPSVPASGWG